MIVALAQSRAFATGFIEFDFPSGTRRLMLGSGEVSYGGNVYKGTDPTFGTIAGGEGVREDTSGEAPNTSLTIAIHPDADRSEIASEEVQLTPVRIYLAALSLDANKHLVAIPDPELLAEGFIDQPLLSLDKKKEEVDYSITSAFDYFFEDSEGQRLSPAFYGQIYPTETGLDNVTGVTRKIYWGTYGPGGSGSAVGGGSFGTTYGGGGGIATGTIPNIV
jgi:hypothetical protein